MFDQTSSVDATILFDCPLGVDFVNLVNELERPFRNIALEFDETAVAEDSHAVFINESIVLRIGYGPNENFARDLSGVARPTQSRVSTTMVETLLESVQASLVVSVERGAGRVVPDRILLGACFHVVRHLLRSQKASLVHWSHSNTLFTAEEFESPTLTGYAPQPRRPERSAAAEATPRPKMGMAMGAGKFQESHMQVSRNHDRLDESFANAVRGDMPGETTTRRYTGDSREEERLRRARRRIFASDMIESEDVKRSAPPEEIGLLEQLSVYVMTITLMVLSFPVGFAMLIYNVLRGENLKMTARAMALTGVGVGLASTQATQTLLSMMV
ncbi:MULTISPECIES: hypothetical protein [Actibacterium]|jgi:hypothetical protein|uniref:Uncharacterized protein n=1 Tax=Actibacterium naphthalenivorans TaxID=1614693 RepID=A0A840CES9_9RHOB|nr:MULTISPECIES: hypothetical protein [Actibacterium]ALG90136.1 hypothetical protein TQ29_08010 [Actibacterium sp. EMB200-NS6]MBB4022018.1 hypothetical protein [Actibacterium naphthalenivorans]